MRLYECDQSGLTSSQAGLLLMQLTENLLGARIECDNLIKNYCNLYDQESLSETRDKLSEVIHDIQRIALKVTNTTDHDDSYNDYEIEEI